MLALAVQVQVTPPVATPDIQSLEPATPIERQLKFGETHTYKIALDTGQFLDAAVNQRGVDVVVRLFAPDGSNIADIDSPNGTEGDEPIAIEAKSTGAYRIDITTLTQNGNGPAGRYEIRVNAIWSAAEYAAHLAEEGRAQQAVIAELKSRAIAITSVEADNGFDDLQPLRRVLKDVRIVGLGEETHGPREFFQFKHRMVEFLVKEMDFRVFAIEASYSACQTINDYVMGRMDDGTKALKSQGFWTWDTEEVQALLDWMRAYNASVQPDRRVQFAGVDIQVNEPGQAKLLDYLGRVAPERSADTAAFFKNDINKLIETAFTGKGDGVNAARANLKALKDQYNDLLVFLELNASRLVSKSSQTEYEQMREYARVLAQCLDVYSRPKLSATVRDNYMADNFQRLVSREPAATRFIVWAHNEHVSTGGRQPTLGSRLRQSYGGAYYAVGFSFNQGSFQALGADPADPQKLTLVPFNAIPARVGSVDWYLAETHANMGFVDLQSAAKSKTIASWMSVAHPMRAIGSTYDGMDKSYVPIVLKDSFDGLFFIDSTTRAHPLR
jgi:erythromycin esterase